MSGVVPAPQETSLWSRATWEAYHRQLRPQVPGRVDAVRSASPAPLEFQLVEVLARNTQRPWQPPDTDPAGVHWVGPLPPGRELLAVADFEELLRDSTFRSIEYEDTCPDPLDWDEAHHLREAAPTVMLLLGTDARGAEVAVLVHGFRPGFYVQQDVGNNVTKVRIQAALRRAGITDVQITPEDRTPLYGWHPRRRADGSYDARRRERRRFFHLSFCNDTVARRAASTLERRLRAAIFENRISVVDQFMRRCDLTMSRWVRISDPRPPAVRRTISHVEVECSLADVRLAEEFTRSAPMIVCCVDIETDSADGAFPMSSRDPVVSIGTTFHIAGDEEPRLKLMLGLHETEPDDAVQIHWFRTEAELLVAWRQILVLLGPVTFITGWNTSGFDFKFMADRARLVLPRASQFWYLSRVMLERTPVRTQQLDSAALGDNTLVYFHCEGVVMLDMMQFVKSNLKYTSYALGFVSKQLLGEDKTKVRLDLEGWGCRTVARLLATLRETGATADGGGDVVAAMADLVRTWDEDTIPPGDELERMHGLLDALRKPLHKWFRRRKPEDQVRGRIEREFREAEIAVGDENYQKLFRLFKMTGPVGARARRKIMVYCATDCDLPIYIMEALSVVARTVAMSEVSHTSMHQICNGGQQQKVFSLIYRFASKRGFIVPQKKRNDETCSVGWDPTMPFQGATVLEPERGFYVHSLDQITVLDFASLYPSIMRSHNLCYTTLVAVLDTQLKRRYDADPDGSGSAALRRDMVLFGSLDKMERCDNGVFETVEIGTRTCVWAGVDPASPNPTPRGILPEILTELLTARGRQKKEMKKYKKQVRALKERLAAREQQVAAAGGHDEDPAQLADLRKQLRRATEGASNANGRQLALKISANSVYGFTGVGEHMAKLPNPAVANSVTTFGRAMIHDTKRFMEDRGCLVVYGDSVVGSTPVLVRLRGRLVRCTTVEDLAAASGTGPWTPTTHADKEAVETPELEAWTAAGWTRVHRIIRHRLHPDKGLVRVTTPRAVVVCTTDHSLLRASGDPVAPRDLKLGDPLLHSLPPCVASDPDHIVHPVGDRVCEPTLALRDLHVVINNYAPAARATFVRTMCPSLRVRVPVDTPAVALAWVLVLRIASGRDVRVAKHATAFLCRAARDDDDESDDDGVRSVEPVTPTGDAPYVFDLTTTSAHWHAGVGSLIVHNTDSVFIRFPPELNVDTVTKAFERGLALGEECTEHLWGQYNWRCERVKRRLPDGSIELEHGGATLRPDEELRVWRPHPTAGPQHVLVLSKLVDLEFEKVYKPFMIKDKKRYVGLKYEGSPDHAPKVDAKGIEFIRRDNCAALRKCMVDIVDRTIKKGQADAAVGCVMQLLERIHQEQVPLEELVISKARRRTYSLRTKPVFWGSCAATPRVVWLDEALRPCSRPSRACAAVFVGAQDGHLIMWDGRGGGAAAGGEVTPLRVLSDTTGDVERVGDGLRLTLPRTPAIACRRCAAYGKRARADAARRFEAMDDEDQEATRRLFAALFPGRRPQQHLVRLLVGRSFCRPDTADVCESLCAVCSENLTTQPHLTVVQNQIRRRDFDVVRVGGRVPYVFVVTEEEKAYRSAEHPSRVDDASRVDWHYYLENQIRKPILRLVEYMPGVQTIVERMNGLAAELKGRRGKRLRGTLNLRDFAAAAATTAESTTTRRNVKKKKKATPPSVRRKRQLPAPKSNVEMRRTRKKRLQDGPRNGLRRFVSK